MTVTEGFPPNESFILRERNSYASKKTGRGRKIMDFVVFDAIGDRERLKTVCHGPKTDPLEGLVTRVGSRMEC